MSKDTYITNLRAAWSRSAAEHAKAVRLWGVSSPHRAAEALNRMQNVEAQLLRALAS